VSAADALTIAELAGAARARVDPAVFDYCSGGAEDELAVTGNTAAFREFRLSPRVLSGSGPPALEASLLGAPVAFPVLVAPVGLQRMYDPAGEVVTARVAARHGTVFCLSMLSSRTIEDVAEAASSSRRWFQVYLVRDRALVERLVGRAQEAGFDAVMVTVDYPAVGKRERDPAYGAARFEAFPPSLLDDLALLAEPGDGKPGALERLHSIFPNPFASWDDLEWLASILEVPLVVKGVLRPEDARRAADAGAAAVVVSNHGGRQLDRAPASIDALAAVVDEVGDDVEVYLDSGVRRGSDVAVALALGASAVLVGRPVMWGLAAAGEAGANRALGILRDELTTTLALLGAASPAELDRSFLHRLDRASITP
jgi:4-hydroxymandelate oxidase